MSNRKKLLYILKFTGLILLIIFSLLLSLVVLLNALSEGANWLFGFIPSGAMTVFLIIVLRKLSKNFKRAKADDYTTSYDSIYTYPAASDCDVTFSTSSQATQTPAAPPIIPDIKPTAPHTENNNQGYAGHVVPFKDDDNGLVMQDVTFVTSSQATQTPAVPPIIPDIKPTAPHTENDNRCYAGHVVPFKGNDNGLVMQTDYDLKIEALQKENKTIAFFDENGVLEDIFPRDESTDRRRLANSAQYISILDDVYNTLDCGDVKNIPVPYYRFSADSTFNLEYILRMHLNRTEDAELETVIAGKTIQLMKQSDIFYPEKDYLIILGAVMTVGEFEEADKLYADIAAFLKEEYQHNHLSYEEIVLKNEENNAGYPYFKAYMQKRFQQMKEYNLIKETLPELAPKSYPSYARMKTANSKDFQNIQSLMSEKGFEI